MSRNVLGTEILRDQAARNLAVEVKMLRTANTTNLGITACWRTHQKCCKSLPQRDLQGLEPSGIEQDFGFDLGPQSFGCPGVLGDGLDTSGVRMLPRSPLEAGGVCQRVNA